MKSADLTEVRRIESAEGIPSGEYQGVWSGYTVAFSTEFGNYEARSSIGIRGINVPCAVSVSAGKITVSAK